MTLHTDRPLEELLKLVRDDKLELPALEKYRDELIHVRTDLHRRRAELRKQRALYMIASKELTVAAKKLAWDAKDEGQRLFEVEGDLGGITLEIDALMSRIYSKIR